jgi:hypothetical protein
MGSASFQMIQQLVTCDVIITEIACFDMSEGWIERAVPSAFPDPSESIAWVTDDRDFLQFIETKNSEQAGTTW